MRALGNYIYMAHSRYRESCRGQSSIWKFGSRYGQSWTLVTRCLVGQQPALALAGKQKRQRYKTLKITQHGMVKRRSSYGSIWHSLHLSLSLSNICQLWPLSRNKVWELYFYKEKCYGHSSSMPIHHSSLHYTGMVYNTLTNDQH